MMLATPTKLRSGEWGAKVQGEAYEGDLITVQARSGKSWTAQVVKVVWKGEGVAIVATASRGGSRGGSYRSSSSRGRNYSGTYECPECGRYVRPGSQCWETGATH